MKVYRPVVGQMSPLWWIFIGVITVALVLPIYGGVRTLYGGTSMHYVVEADAVSIKYGFDTIRMPLEQIEKVEVVQTSRGRRVAGTSMTALKEGRWDFPETGPIRLYASRTSPLVVVTIGGQQIGITPERTDEFLQALQGQGGGTFAPVDSFGAAAVLTMVLLSIGVPLATIALLMYISRAGRHMTYTLGEQGLEIEVGISRVAVKYAAIRSVSIEEPDGVPLRTFGTSMPGMHWGAFRWKAAGENLKLYATRIKPLVLVKTDRGTFGITPEDPEEFVADVKKRIEQK